MRVQAARLLAIALGSTVVSLGAYVLWLNVDIEHDEDEVCADFVRHLHLPGGLVLWS